MIVYSCTFDNISYSVIDIPLVFFLYDSMFEFKATVHYGLWENYSIIQHA